MEFLFCPNNLNAGAHSCTITIICDAPDTDIRWRFESTTSDKMMITNKKIIAKKNGTYYVELSNQNETIQTEFHICHLGEKVQFDGGNGSADSPYLISTCAQFNAIRSNLSAHYRLMADLDFSTEMKNLEWIPVGKFSQKEPKILKDIPIEEQDLTWHIDWGFTGELDGNRHVISGIKCVRSKLGDVGLFGAAGNGALIHHLKVENCLFVGETCVGSLVGTANDILVYHCHVSAIVCSSLFGGGLLGHADGAVCYANSYTGVIQSSSGHSCLGGIVGNAIKEHGSKVVDITDCYVNAKIVGDYPETRCAGITNGWAWISRCFFCGEIRGTGTIAGIATGCLSVNSSVCAASRIMLVDATRISEKSSFWAVVYDNFGFPIMDGDDPRSEYFSDVFRNFLGRIVDEDLFLKPHNNKNKNFAASSCQLCADNIQFSAIDGSIRDGLTISEGMLKTKSFYTSTPPS